MRDTKKARSIGVLLLGFFGGGCGGEPIVAVSSTVTLSSTATPTAGPTAASDAVDLVMGDRHVCRLLRGGRVDCWGSNEFGQLGDGTLADSPTPVRVSGISDATAIFGAERGTCAIAADRSVHCWGRHPTWDEPRPWEHERAAPKLLPDGAGASWGSMSWNILVTVGPDGIARGLPEELAGLPPMRALAANAVEGCAIFKDDSVACFGFRAQSTWPRARTDLPEASGKGAVSIALHATGACLVTTGGDVRCFSHNGPESFVSGIDDAVQISEDGGGKMCVATRSGRVGCFTVPGRARAGRTAPPEPVQWVANVTTARKVVMSSEVTCALLTSGDVSCWGNGAYGELGNGTRAVYREPVVMPGLPRMARVAVTGQEAVALAADGSVYRWGGRAPAPVPDNFRLEGAAPVEEKLESMERLFDAPTDVCVMSRANKVFCRRSPSVTGPLDEVPKEIDPTWETMDLLDVVDMQGVVPKWQEREGEHHGGSTMWIILLGSGRVEALAATEREHGKVTRLSGIEKAVAISVVEDHACAVLEGGVGVCWHHQSVDGAVSVGEPSATPVLVTVKSAKPIARAEGHCFVDVDGVSTCYRIAVDGLSMLPLESPGQSAAFRREAGQRCMAYDRESFSCGEGIWDIGRLLAPTFLDVSTGPYGSCAVRAQGDVVCWGDSRLGPLGVPGTWRSDSPVVVRRLSL